MKSASKALLRESTAAVTDGTPDWLQLTARYVQELQYGQVLLTIHQGDVIEVQKTEKTRLQARRSS
ncbi:MAG: hypothetical protein E1N59_3300 [Puniceicoccaceae bacterium 5H]|nr:MAG: hypothetical protein E1N59_3300 [Puniceicoccaceae bacterium 5H]